jgi:hypothetical protein
MQKKFIAGVFEIQWFFHRLFRLIFESLTGSVYRKKCPIAYTGTNGDFRNYRRAMMINSIPVAVVGGAYDIAVNYLKQTGRIPEDVDIYQRLFDSIVDDFRAGTANKLRLANRAIARIERADEVLELI